MYAYADPKSRTRYEALGFRLVETLPVLLPRGATLGRYVFDSTGAGGTDIGGTDAGGTGAGATDAPG
jgi:hypothetical protein